MGIQMCPGSIWERMANNPEGYQTTHHPVSQTLSITMIHGYKPGIQQRAFQIPLGHPLQYRHLNKLATPGLSPSTNGAAEARQVERRHTLHHRRGVRVKRVSTDAYTPFVRDILLIIKV